jgi:hypothetical protein
VRPRGDLEMPGAQFPSPSPTTSNRLATAVEFSRAAHKQRRDPVTATPEQRRLSAVTLGNFHRIWWLYPNADSSEQGFDPDSGGGY